MSDIRNDITEQLGVYGLSRSCRDVLIRSLAEIERLQEFAGVHSDGRMNDRKKPDGDYIVPVGNTYQRFAWLADAVVFAGETGAKVYERLASDAARQVCEIEVQAAEIEYLQSIVSTICDGATCNGFTAGSQRVNATHWVIPKCDGIGVDSLLAAAEKARETC